MRTVEILLSLLIFAVTVQAQETPSLDYESIRRSRVYRITRTTTPIVVDGKPDEAAWSGAEGGRDFYQTDPVSGVQAIENKEFRILYDDNNIYISVVCYQKGPITISELSRDFAPGDGDIVTVVFDPFDDDRNGLAFQTN